MKIIKKGDGNQVRCGSCKSVLEFEPSDVSRKSDGRDDDGDELFSYSVACLSCGARISVSSHLTSDMRRRVGEVQRSRDISDYDL